MTRKTLILLGFLLLKFLLQYILISPHYDLQRDEYLHLDQAHHLAWGYQSIPPFTSWISYIILQLGNSVFWIKFFPALFGALTIVVVWKATEALNGNLFALMLGATCVLFSALLRLNTLFQPNSFDVLCWTGAYYIFIRYIQTEHSKWLYAGAVVVALGFLNKYNIIFLAIGLLPALLFTEHRNLFARKAFYFSLSLAFVMILPNLVWQFRHGFPVIHHLQELSSTQLVHVNRLDFLQSQVFFFIGALVVILSGFYALIFYKPFKKYRVFVLSAIFTLLVFIFFKAKDYYAIGLYPIYVSFGSVFLADKLKQGWQKYLQPVLMVIPVLFFIPMFNVLFPNNSPDYIMRHKAAYQKLGLLRWEDGKEHALPQDFADMLGWEELAKKVDSVYATLPHPDNTLILCDNYGQAGAINYYTENKKIVAHSFNADYIDWFQYDKKFVDVLLVKEADDEDSNRNKEIPLFDIVYLAGKRINPFAREDTISMYVLRGAKFDVNERLKEEAERRQHERIQVPLP